MMGLDGLLFGYGMSVVFWCELDISLMIKNMTSIDEHDLWIECSEKSIDFTGV